MKKAIFFIIIVIFSMSLNAKKSKFPFQNPHRFSKTALIQGSYASGNYLVGDITIREIPCGEWIYFKGAFGNDSLSQQQCYGPPSEFIQVYKANKPIDTFDPMLINPLLITDSRGNKGLIARRYENNNDQIVFYLSKADGKSGVKLIFDVDKFEKFLTQTYEYDNLKKGPEIKAMVLNFTFNDAYFDFIDNRPGVKPPARSWSIPWVTISYERKGALHPITDWRVEPYFDEKTKQTAYKTVSENDLLGDTYGKIIKILPMSEEDIKIVLKQKY